MKKINLDNFQIKLGERIKKIRKSNNYTQADLAKMLETSESTISKIEKGQFLISLRTLVQLSEMLGCELADMVDFNAELHRI